MIKSFILKNPGEERSAARNYGFQISNGQYICFIDDDDFVSNKYLESFSNALGLDDHPLHRVEFQYVKGNKIIQPTKIETTNNVILNTLTTMIGIYIMFSKRNPRTRGI
ncbi:MAG: glycosyltransferase family A protein [Saprospiraceae bacterium]